VTYESYDGGVLLGNDYLCKIVDVGTIRIKMHDGIIRTLMGVRHIPDLTKNLISLGSLEDGGCKFQSDGGVLKVLKCTLTLMKAKKVGTLYFLEGTSIVGIAVFVNSTSDSDNTNLWHMRLGHMSERGMTILSKEDMLFGQSTGKLDFCEDCVFGKQKMISFSTGVHSTKGTLDYIHSDLWGPSCVPSKGNGSRYMLTFIDDFSRKIWVFFLKVKSKVFAIFKQWKTLIENQTGKKIKRLRTDNGLEFCNEEFNKFCKNEGIVRHRTIVCTPQ
jgi:GAG-pre-integrase domain/Integrase core domain